MRCDEFEATLRPKIIFRENKLLSVRMIYNEWTFSSRTLRVSVVLLAVSSVCVILSFSTPHWLDSYGTQRLPNPKFTNLGILMKLREGKPSLIKEYNICYTRV